MQKINEDENVNIRTLLINSKLFKRFSDNEYLLQKLINSCQLINKHQGDIITYIGNKIEYIYLITQGNVSIFLKKSPEYLQDELRKSVSKSVDKKNQSLLRLYKNFSKIFGGKLKIKHLSSDLFSDQLTFLYYYVTDLTQGEMIGNQCIQLNGDHYHQLTICNMPTSLLQIPVNLYRQIFAEKIDKRNKVFQFIINKVFSDLTLQALRKILPFFQKVKFTKGQIIYSQLQKIKHFYLIQNGDVILYKDFNSDKAHILCNRKQKLNKIIYACLGNGEYFGEEELMNNLEYRMTSASCNSSQGILLFIPLNILQTFMQQKPDLKHIFKQKEQAKLDWRLQYSISQLQSQNNSQEKILNRNVEKNTNEDFQFIRNHSIDKYLDKKIKLNNLIQHKYINQSTNLDNIPLNNQLLRKKILRYEKKEEVYKQQNNSSDVIERFINLTQMKKKSSQKSLEPIKSHRVQSRARSMSQYLIQVTRKKNQQKFNLFQ